MTSLNKNLLNIIDKSVKTEKRPSILAIEMGHLKVTDDEESDFNWSRENINYTENLIQNIIKRYNRKIRIIPTIIVNNFSSKNKIDTTQIKSECIKTKRFIKKSKVSVFLEKNLRNRVMAKLKKSIGLKRSYDRVFLIGQDPVCNIPIASVSLKDKWTIIPKCGLITYLYISDIVSLAKQRLFSQKNILIGVISFSEHWEEVESMKIGYEIQLCIDKKTRTYAIMVYWKNKHEFIIHYRYPNDSDWRTINSKVLGNKSIPMEKYNIPCMLNSVCM